MFLSSVFRGNCVTAQDKVLLLYTVCEVCVCVGGMPMR